ncbi:MULTISPECIES: hypothetical protein [unclassified Tolypothrix]|uniref:hypothetical protein n=1 Tax=unclassified Tolypothrix TaxID=2649714 RepID=UPI0005EABA10|nr:MULTISPECIES: hypothetical protein [unclassified Tolypothrix]BAY95811.1 hypothetical protein NIES3275_78880 [Microchaete diplosiphon NIES-3275]EKE98175.1 hypothetical protein FDUTEX481_04192 [Tolypothrix sp. PCC 7601]MBE9086562.1 hypothetical protein [Tolypothrix sp. LEGE 11397]UYD30805.1 hypothetical protein HGR01_38580 [Tolypothrix sp. PCC 7712]UYD38720.1 hypothetical protein HG267_40010 [Tolypothrix sp. PCC 7601]
MQNHLPKITTKQTEYLRGQYPSLSYLEAGNIAEWLQERKDQLFELAREAENAADLTRVLGLVAGGIGTICYAVNPFMLVGGMIGGAAWLWFVVEHHSRTKEIAPLPFVRGNFMDAIARAGDYDARLDYQADYLANTVKFLERPEAEEYAFLHAQFENISQYLSQVEPGKRFYAYRWMFGWFGKLKGRQLPTYESMVDHLQHVTIDSRVNYEEVQAVQATQELPPTVDIRQLQPASTEITNTQSPTFNLTALPSLPLNQRAEAVVNALTRGGFKIDECLGSQVVAICGTQRGGKGTLAAILATISKALDFSLDVQYFTAGVDIYPFACNLTSALDFPQRDSDAADKSVADELLQFLKKLDGSQPYAHKNLLLVIDEAMRLLSLLEEGDRTWAIQYLLSRFAKCGGTLIIVLHGSNLTSVVGKATAGLADTFKQSVSFIGCVAQSVKAKGLRKINVASGAYFKANPNNFGEPIAGGELGAIPEWLKTDLHPGNGQPDPARTLLKVFPELVQQHFAAPSSVISQLENNFKAAPHEDIEPPQEMVKDEDFEQIMVIVAHATSFPVSFEAIRKSRKWGEENKSVRYLRLALKALTEAGKLHGNEKDGYRVQG